MQRKHIVSILVLGLGLLGAAGVMAVADRGLLPSVDLAMPAKEKAAPAPEVDTAALEEAWRDWMAAEGIEASSMAAGAAGEVQFETGRGRDPDLPYPVMSLSKAVTAVCAAELLGEAHLTWNASLGGIADILTAGGVTPPHWAQTITLAQLVTHSSGMKPDITQGALRSKLHGSLGLHRRIGFQAMQRENLTGTQGEYFYANSNYALLGAIIEGLSGQSYAEACRQRITDPAGAVGAVIEGRSGSMSSYAGWEMSAGDYARVAMHWFSGQRPWVIQPSAYPSLGGYGLGAWVDGAGEDARIWHTGRLCFGAEEGKGNGAIFVATGAGAAFVANWEGCIDARAYDRLRKAVTPHLD